MRTLLLILFPLWLFAQNCLVDASGNRLHSSGTYLTNWENLYYIDGDGTTDRLRYSTNQSLGTTHSISFWINLKDASTSTYSIIAALGLSDLYNTIYIYYTSPDAVIKYTTSANSSQSITFTKDDNWHHIVLTRNNASIVYYKDGVLFDTDTHGSSSATFTIRYLLSGKYSATNWIDEIAFYSSELRDIDVAILYGGGTPQTCGNPQSIPNLINYVGFETLAGCFYDVAAKKNLLSEAGGVSITDCVNYSENKYILFGGTNESVYYASELNLGSTHTVSFWCASSSTITVLGGSTTANYIIISNSGFYYRCANKQVLMSYPTVTAGAWYHYVLVRNGGDLTLYRNGLLVNTGTLENSEENFLWKYVAKTGSLYSVSYSCDNIVTYSTALTADNVKTLYNNGMPTQKTLYTSIAGLTHYLNFEQGIATITDQVTSEVLTQENMETTDITQY